MRTLAQQNRSCFASYRMGIKGGIISSPEYDIWHLLQNLPSANTLLVNMGLGNLVCSQFLGQSMHAHDWQKMIDAAVLLGGGNQSLSSELPYSPQHYASVLQTMGGNDPMQGIETVIIHGWGIQAILESHCLGLAEWAGKDNNTAFHNLQSALLIRLLRQIFRASLRGIDVWITFPLKQADESAGLKYRLIPNLPDEAVLELMSLSDFVLSMADVRRGGSTQTALITDPNNTWGYPAKASKAFGLNPLEPTDLPALTKKIMGSIHNRGQTEPLKDVF
jgi:hypothetical protein